MLSCKAQALFLVSCVQFAFRFVHRVLVNLCEKVTNLFKSEPALSLPNDSGIPGVPSRALDSEPERISVDDNKTADDECDNTNARSLDNDLGRSFSLS